MDIREHIGQVLINGAKECGVQIENPAIVFSNRPDLSDFQSNICFSLAKEYHISPVELSERICSACNNDSLVFSSERGFINIRLGNDLISIVANELYNDSRIGVLPHKNKMTVLFDYGGANVAKELHVGHLCSPIIGEGMKRLYNLFGHNTYADAHLGDWGLQMGLTILQLYEDGVLNYYFKGEGAEPLITLEMLNTAYPKASKRKNDDKTFKARADEFTKHIQDKEEPYYTIYNKIRSLSIKEIENLYGQLNAYFDFWYGESSCAGYTDTVVQIFKDKGLARSSNGALIVDVAKEGEHIPLPKKSEDEEQRYKNPMPPAIIQKYNGADLYATTDIATIYMRNKDIKELNEIIYYTDNRQNMHFEQVFRCCKMTGISPERQKLTHIGFGTMNGKDGKPFKTRDGGVVKLDDVIQLLIDRASEKLKSNGVVPTRELALAIGVGAMKFGALSNYVTKDYVFDLDSFLAFEGKTGPYLQYTVARINSIFNKTTENVGEISIDDDQREIIINILKLNNAYQLAFDEKSLNGVCSSAYDVASAFSSFYSKHHILNERNTIKQRAYLGLIDLVRRALTQALNVLAIDIPSQM